MCIYTVKKQKLTKIPQKGCAIPTNVRKLGVSGVSGVSGVKDTQKLTKIEA